MFLSPFAIYSYQISFFIVKNVITKYELIPFLKIYRKKNGFVTLASKARHKSIITSLNATIL